jgi:hypothetical protein
MNHGYVTLDEVVGAAAARAAALAPETSGYLALAIGDASARLPLAIEARAVMLTTEGSVSLARRGEPLPPKQAARALREVVARLLAVSAGTMPGLAATARPRDESDRGVEAVVEELEAALIPVNRAAARRALGRLARETLKAKELGRFAPVREAAPMVERAVVAAPAALSALGPAHISVPETDKPSALPEACSPEAAPTPAPSCVAESRAEGFPVLSFATAPSPTPGLTVPSPEHAVFIAAEEPVTAPLRLLEPTPTALGMPAVEIIDPTPSDLLDVGFLTTLDVVTSMEFAPTPSDALTLPLVRLAPLAPAPEPRQLAPAAEVLAPAAHEFATLSPLPLPVLAQVQSTRLAIAAPLPPADAETLTPPLAGLEAQPVIAAPVIAAPVIAAPTRADALLARFGAICDDDASMREAAACLKKFAGLDPTPPPPSLGTRPSARALTLPWSSRRDPLELVEVAPAPPASVKRSAFGIGTVLVFGALVGALAFAYARPDRVAVLTARLLALGAAEPARPARTATDTAAR